MGAKTERSGGDDSGILVAIELGWCMAELYDKVRPAELAPPQPPPEQLREVSPRRDDQRVRLQADLPGLGALGDGQELELLFDRVSVGLGRLCPLITGAGLTVPADESWRSLAGHRRSPEGRYQLARAVLEFHSDLLVDLTACDHQVGLAYGLGRAVADLSLRPCTSNETTFTEDFRHGRAGTIIGWLRELHTALPAHAAAAVIGSIAQWQQWAARPSWYGQPLAWPDHGSQVVGALEQQGRRWRLLLTGQVAPLDELGPEDYVQAAGFLAGRVRQIGQRLLLQYWPLAAGFTAAMAAAVAGSLILLNSPAAKGIGVAVSVFGWLGITGRSLSVTLRRTAGRVEESLWQGELDLAAAWANTNLPAADSDRRLGEVRPPPFPAGRSWQPQSGRRAEDPAKRSPGAPPPGN